MSADCAACFYCEATLSPRHEHDHWPTAARHGGTHTVPICVNCHDLKDRTAMNNVPVDVWFKAFKESGPLGRILIARASSVLADFYANQERVA